jgi:cytochrome c oxidase assembly protein subunit 15
MATLVRISLLLVIVLVTVSAYLRLDHSGIGCEPWPACYGNIGVPIDSPSAAGTYERLLEEASEPLSWATPLHRLVASVLGLAILGMTLLSLQQRKDRVAAFSLLALTVFLAWLGIYSEGLHSPAVVMGNLCGGFAMLGILGWLVVRKPLSPKAERSRLHFATIAALIFLGGQIFIGGLTSANFAASACQTIPDCHGSWLPGPDVFTAFDLSRVHDIGSSGMVLGGPERAAIHKLHRITALIAAAMVMFAGFLAVRAGRDLRIVGIALIVVVVLEFSLGIASILAGLPIVLAVAHNWLAAILVLAMLKLFAESQAGSG